jgi:hypothetical protein
MGIIAVNTVATFFVKLGGGINACACPDESDVNLAFVP